MWSLPIKEFSVHTEKQKREREREGRQLKPLAFNEIVANAQINLFSMQRSRD